MTQSQPGDDPVASSGDISPGSDAMQGGNEPDRVRTGWSSLWDAFARGVRDNMVGEVVVQAVRIGGMVFLARALRPQDFGLLKVLAVVGAFAVYLVEAGISEALIQRPDLRREHEVTAWWSSLLTALTFTAVLYFSAPWLASLMEMKDLTFGTRLLCIPVLLHGIAVCADARLHRELRFGAIAAANVLSEISFLTTALVLWFQGFPQWSLPAALGARLGIHALVLMAADARVPLGVPQLSAARDLARFAGTVMVGGLVTTGSSNVDYLLVGRLLGSTALGYYSMAWDLFRFIPDRLHRIAGLVAFPAFCQLQENDAELALAYTNFFNYLGRLVLPVVGCVVIAAPELLGSVYGAKWVSAAMPMRVLAFGLALFGIRGAMGLLYWAKNHPSFEIYLSALRLVLIIAGIGLTAPLGLAAICGAVGSVEAVITVVGQYLVCLLLGMRLREVAPALVSGLRIAAACAAATAVGKLIGGALSVQAPLILAFVAVPPAVVFCWLQIDEVFALARRALGGRLSGTMNAAQTL